MCSAFTSAVKLFFTIVLLLLFGVHPLILLLFYGGSFVEFTRWLEINGVGFHFGVSCFDFLLSCSGNSRWNNSTSSLIPRGE